MRRTYSHTHRYPTPGSAGSESRRPSSISVLSHALTSANWPEGPCSIGGRSRRSLSNIVAIRKFVRIPAIAVMILATFTVVHAQTPGASPTPASITLSAGVNVLVSQASTTANYVINSSAGNSTLIFEIGDTGTQCGSNTTTLGGGSGSLAATYGALPPNVDLCVVSPVGGITLTLAVQ